MNKTLFSVIAAAALLAALPVSAGDVERGRQLSQVCVACHGVDGNGVGDPNNPKIGGQHADYLEFALRAYRSGERENAIMYGFASQLSDRDIRDLAAFYAAQERRLRLMPNPGRR